MSGNCKRSERNLKMFWPSLIFILSMAFGFSSFSASFDRLVTLSLSLRSAGLSSHLRWGIRIFIGKRKVDKVQHPRATAITFEFGRHNDTYTKVPQHPKSNRSTVEGVPIFLKKPYFFNFTKNGSEIYGCWGTLVNVSICLLNSNVITNALTCCV